MSKQNQGSESYTMPTEAQLKLVSASARRGVVASAKVSDAVRDCLRIVILENGDNVREAAVEELFARFYKANPRKTRYAVYMTLAQYKTKVGKLAKRVGWKAKMSEAFSVEGQRLETSLQFGVVKGGKGKTRGKKAAPKAKAGSLLEEPKASSNCEGSHISRRKRLQRRRKPRRTKKPRPTPRRTLNQIPPHARIGGGVFFLPTIHR